MTTTYSSAPIPPKFRTWLETFFRPYNQRLYGLLGPELEGVFDETPPSLLEDKSYKRTQFHEFLRRKQAGIVVNPASYNGSHPPVHGPLPEARHVKDQSLPLYVRQHCDLTGVDSWMLPQSDWRVRSPSFFILGAKKGGTTGLFNTLTSHPQVVRGTSKELLYFVPKRFPFWNKDQIGDRVRVDPARKALLQEFPRQLLRRNETVITGEATPDYIMYSEYSSQAILCTTPWVKLVVLLRDPIDRLFSHYNYLTDPSRAARILPNFDVWVKKDIAILQEFGVMPQDLSRTSIQAYMGSPEERDGWHRYQRALDGPWADRPFVRSLYALQLEDWYRNLRAVGKDPTRDMRVLLSRDVQKNDHVVRDLFKWLGVNVTSATNATPMETTMPNHESNRRKLTKARTKATPTNFSATMKQSMITTYTSAPIKPEFRKWLETILEPYNRRLYRLLGKDFDGIFDPTPSPSSA